MNGVLTLYVDQFGGKWYAKTVKDLRDQIGGGHVSKMYIDKKDGATVHVGYVVGRLWCRMYRPVEITAQF